MNWFVVHVASGGSFFSGLLLLLLSILMPVRRHRALARIRPVLMVAAAVLIAVSSTPIPYWAYGLLTAALGVWVLARDKRRRLASAGVIAACLLCGALEIPYHFIPQPDAVPDRSLAIIGDSVTAGLGENGEEIWPSILARRQDVRVQDLSHVGETAASAHKRLQQHALDAPLVLVEIGGNDILGSTTAKQFGADLDALLAAVAAPGRQVVMFELPLPPFYHEFGRMQRAAARRHNVALIPKRVFLGLLAGNEATLDTIHLSQSGHEQMANAVWQLVGPAYGTTAPSTIRNHPVWPESTQFVAYADEERASAASQSESETRRLLYVAEPGIRNYLEYGGHGLLVFDIDDGHRFVKRIPTRGLNAEGDPSNVKGICAHAGTQRLYISTLEALQCLDLVSEEVLWEREYPSGCDRMALSPDGAVIYQPSLEKDDWYVLDAENGDVIRTITPRSKAHNTVYGPDGKWCYMAGLGSPLLSVADTSTHTIAKRVGPFSHVIRPFTVNGRQTRCYVCINGLLGFEVGDITTGEKLHRVEVQGFEQGPVKRHGCPSHGIGLTPDETEIWVVDGHNRRVHIFDNTVEPPRQLESIELRDEPGWVTFSIDGTLAWPSTGDVIDVATRRIVTQLTDEEGRPVMSEKLLEIDIADGKPVRAGNQFGVGGVR